MRSKKLVILLALVAAFAGFMPVSDAKGRNRSNKKDNKEIEDKQDEVDSATSRKGKLFSLFNVVQFRNGPCTSTATLSTGSSNRNGTCFTVTECADKGGTAQGNCAAGFGVCCVFLVTGENGDSTVNQNCSYIQNPGFPSAVTTPTAQTYTINRCSNDVCQLRLDFEVFDIAGIIGTNEVDEGVCQDTFTVTSTANHQIPVICGENGGQHIYVDAADATTLSFAFAAITDNRQWDIKVTQVECSNANSAPNGCLQYLTTLTGRITTFNFSPANENHLPNQQYSVCIRPSAGFCCVQYTVCQDVTNGFTLDTGAAPAATSMQDELCTSSDYVAISHSSESCNQGSNLATDSRYCGPALSRAMVAMGLDIPICDCTSPFIVDIFTDNLADGRAIAGSMNANTMTQSRGVCLDYMQIPCE